MSWTCLGRVNAHNGAILALRYNIDGEYILSGGTDKVITLTKPGDDGKILQKYSGHNWDVLDIRIFNDNSKFVSGGLDRPWFLWDVAESRVIKKYYGHDQKITCMQISTCDNIVLSGSYDTTVKIWDMKSASKAPIQTLNNAKDAISHIEISLPDNELIISSIDGHIRRYDIRMGILDEYSLGTPITYFSMLSAPDAVDSQMVFLSTLDSTIRLFELTNSKGILLKEYKGHENKTMKCNSSLLSDEKHIVSGSEDGNIVIWDILSADKKILQGKSPAICNVVSHPNCGVIVSASMDGFIYLWSCS